MPVTSAATTNLASGTVSSDRVVTHRVGPAELIALADGAGGMAGGADTAEAFVRSLDSPSVQQALTASPSSAADWIEATDREIASSHHGGQCTAVIAIVSAFRIIGASVGDSIAWICGDAIVDLTEMQRRKPLVGSGAARATRFAHDVLRGHLMLASDGLWKYAPRERIRETASSGDSSSAVNQLVDLVRLPSGFLPDDVSIVLLDLS